MPDGTKFCGHCGHRAGEPAPAVNPAGGNIPPRVIVTKDRHNRGRGNFLDAVLRVVIIIVLLVIGALAVMYVQDQYATAGGTSPAASETNRPSFGPACRRIGSNLLTPLRSHAPAAEPELVGLRRQAATLKQDDRTRDLAGAVIAFCDEADRLATARNTFLGELGSIETAPVATLSPNESDQDRTKDFMRDATEKRWADAAGKRRQSLGSAVIRVEQAEDSIQFKKLTAWKRFRIFLGEHVPALGESEPPAPQMAVCSTCKGRGAVTCKACRGFGSVKSTSSVVCKQCAGAGQYQSKMSKSKVRCPFCGGSGKTSTDSQQSCGSCDGMGTATCPDCSGKGRKVVTP